MADTYVTCSVSPCTVVYQIDLPVLNLDLDTAGLLAAAIIGVWAVGFAFRSLIRMVRHEEPPPDFE